MAESFQIYCLLLKKYQVYARFKQYNVIGDNDINIFEIQFFVNLINDFGGGQMLYSSQIRVCIPTWVVFGGKKINCQCFGERNVQKLIMPIVIYSEL